MRPAVHKERLAQRFRTRVSCRAATAALGGRLPKARDIAGSWAQGGRGSGVGGGEVVARRRRGGRRRPLLQRTLEHNTRAHSHHRP